MQESALFPSLFFVCTGSSLQCAQVSLIEEHGCYSSYFMFFTCKPNLVLLIFFNFQLGDIYYMILCWFLSYININ